MASLSKSVDFAISQPSQTSLNMGFSEKLDFEAQRKVFQVRSTNIQPTVKFIDYSNVWNIKPVDFRIKLFHSRPPKRNSRDAIKPWEYKKYIRSSDDISPIIDSTKYSKPRKTAQEQMVARFLEKENVPENEIKNEEFERMFRVPTPDEDRFEMATKSMAFRCHATKTYIDPKPHDFRGLQPLYGAPDIVTQFEKDPYNIRFLSENLPTFRGFGPLLSLRSVEPGLQMGEKARTPDPLYDSSLVLPKLPFPNKFHGYTRFRPLDRSVESAFWDHALPKINDKFAYYEAAKKKIADSDVKMCSKSLD